MSYDQHTWWPLGFDHRFKTDKLYAVSCPMGPLVIFRSDNQWAGFSDICPHRGAPLSQGWLQRGQLVCPYHGWCFDAAGKNTFVPVLNKATNTSLETIYLRSQSGLLWAARKAEFLFPEISPLAHDLTLQGNTTATLLNTLENFLEGSHTHYVHNGFIRSEKTQRAVLKARLTPALDGFTVIYEPEPAKGLLTKLLPRNYQLLTPTARYIYPNIAILEYLTRDQHPLIRIEACLNESPAGCTYFARLFLFRPWLRVWGKWLIKQLFGVIVRQDKRILALQKNNLERFPKHQFVSTSADTVGKELYYWLFKPEFISKKAIDFKVYW